MTNAADGTSGSSGLAGGMGDRWNGGIAPFDDGTGVGEGPNAVLALMAGSRRCRVVPTDDMVAPVLGEADREVRPLHLWPQRSAKRCRTGVRQFRMNEKRR